jgi:2-aminoethylphosphonate dioxygenase
MSGLQSSVLRKDATINAINPTHAGCGRPGADERERMRADGYLVVRSFFDEAEVAQILEWTQELAAAEDLPGRQWVYREDSLISPGERVIQRIENFCPFHEPFDRLIRRGSLLRWIEGLIGEPAVLFKEKINFKAPGGSAFKLHQDQQAGWSTYAPLFYTAMVTLERATADNGCLEIATGPRRRALIGQEWQPLQEGSVEVRAVPTEPGDVIFFDSYVPHGSQPNLSTTSRRILYLTYNAAQLGDHRARYYADKHAAFPPDVERSAGKRYVFRV